MGDHLISWESLDQWIFRVARNGADMQVHSWERVSAHEREIRPVTASFPEIWKLALWVMFSSTNTESHIRRSDAPDSGCQACEVAKNTNFPVVCCFSDFPKVEAAMNENLNPICNVPMLDTHKSPRSAR